MSLKILIVDDSPIVRSVIEKNIHMAELPVDECLHAGNGQEGLDQLEGKHLVVWAFVERDLRFGMEGWQPIALWPEVQRQGTAWALRSRRRGDPNQVDDSGSGAQDSGRIDTRTERGRP